MVAVPTTGAGRAIPGDARKVNGRRANAVTSAAGVESEYLQYLPGIYQRHDFSRRFLLIFESVLRPLERMVDNLPLYTEPEMAPAEFLPWLARWVALALDQSWPLDRQRALIANAVEIYRWRGTQRGLSLHITSYTGSVPVIQEFRSGFVLGRQSGLGVSTVLGQSSGEPSTFTVAVRTGTTKAIREDVLRAIIDADKPAHTSYVLQLVRADATAARENRP